VVTLAITVIALSQTNQTRPSLTSTMAGARN
jgi:hypothetical protein